MDSPLGWHTATVYGASISAVLTLTILSASNPFIQSAPGGLGYVSEMLDEARLRDRLSHQQLPDAWLVRCTKHLQRLYPKRLRMRWVEPYSLTGLYLAVRFRIRKFPAVIIGKDFVYNGDAAEELEALVAETLARPTT